MKPTAIFILSISVLSFLAESSRAQSVAYGYDAAGNRISRTIVISQLRRTVQEKTAETQVHSEMLKDLEIRIYPNPTDGILKIELSNMKEGQNADIFLYDLQGKLILKENRVSNSTELNISDRAAGTYILKIIAGESRTEWKIIKK